MMFRMPFIVAGRFQRGRKTTVEEGFVTYLLDVDIPSVTSEEARPICQVWQHGLSYQVRMIGDQCYAPLIASEAERNAVLPLDALRQSEWDKNYSALVQMVRPLINDTGQGDDHQPYSSWDYKHMFTTIAGSAGYGHAAYAPVSDVRTSDISDQDVAVKLQAASAAYQSCRIIDGVPHRPCAEPRFILRKNWVATTIDMHLDEVAPGTSLELSKDKPYEDVNSVVCFRLDRLDDLIDFRSKFQFNNENNLVTGGLHVDILDYGALSFDDELNHLQRTVDLVIRAEYAHLLLASDDATYAWASLKRQLREIENSKSESCAERIANALSKYVAHAHTSEVREAIETAIERFELRPLSPTRSF